MGLFGSKTEVALQLDRPDVVVGDTVTAQVQVGDLDKKARDGRVVLLYRNTYKEDDTDSDGDRRTVTRTADVVVQTLPLGEVGGLRAGTHAVPLVVPPSSPGTSHRSVEWLVRAVVDRKLAGDSVAEQALTVLVPAKQHEDWASSPLECAPECAVQIDLHRRLVRPGDTVSGSFTVRPRDDVQARSLRVRLRRIRFDKDHNSDEQVVAESVLGEDVRLAAGEPRTGSFALALPPDAPPTFLAQHNRQRWYVDVELDRKLRGDLRGRLEVVVHTA